MCDAPLLFNVLMDKESLVVLTEVYWLATWMHAYFWMQVMLVEDTNDLQQES